MYFAFYSKEKLDIHMIQYKREIQAIQLHLKLKQKAVKYFTVPCNVDKDKNISWPDETIDEYEIYQNQSLKLLAKCYRPMDDKVK